MRPTRRMSDGKRMFVDYHLTQALTLAPPIGGLSDQDVMSLPILQAHTNLHQSVYPDSSRRFSPYCNNGHFLLIRMDKQIDPKLLISSNMNPEVSSIMTNVPSSKDSAKRWGDVLLEYITRSTGRAPSKDGQFVYILCFFKESDGISKSQLASLVHAGYNNPHLRQYVQISSGNYEPLIVNDTIYSPTLRPTLLYTNMENGGSTPKTYGVVEIKLDGGRRFCAEDFSEAARYICAAYRESRMIEQVNFAIGQVDEAMHMCGPKIKVATICGDTRISDISATPDKIYRFAKNSKTRSFNSNHFMMSVNAHTIFKRPCLVYVDSGALVYTSPQVSSITQAGELLVVHQNHCTPLGVRAALAIASRVKSPEGMSIITSPDLWSRRVPTNYASGPLSCVHVGSVLKNSLSKEGLLMFVNTKHNNAMNYSLQGRTQTAILTLSEHEYLNGRRDVLLNMVGNFSGPAKSSGTYADGRFVVS